MGRFSPQKRRTDDQVLCKGPRKYLLVVAFQKRSRYVLVALWRNEVKISTSFLNAKRVLHSMGLHRKCRAETQVLCQVHSPKEREVASALSSF
jgi:hypothetical protein